MRTEGSLFKEMMQAMGVNTVEQMKALTQCNILADNFCVNVKCLDAFNNGNNYIKIFE